LANKMTAWDRLQIVREKNRPSAADYIPLVFDRFYELHGDRLYGDDHAIAGGLALIDELPVTLIAQVKGHTLEENKRVNFAMPHPEGYRKALRLMKQAEKFHRPVVCLIDTPGAFCGIGAEERGQGEAIARNLYELMQLKTPIISVVLSEGGSGGALGLGVCDELAMLSNAVYSVISPRGFASILWKDSSREEEAANLMHITAEDLVELKVAESIILEPAGGAQRNPKLMASNITEYLRSTILKLNKLPIDILLQRRYDKFRLVGEYME
jgi:acetyl-CoA carboxylase carboxyl transferase subunit alpha